MCPMSWRRLSRMRLFFACIVLSAVLLGACGQRPATPAAGPPTPAQPAAAAPAPAPAPAAKAPVVPPTPDRLVPPFKTLIPAQGYNPEVYEAAVLLQNEMKKIGLRPEMITHPSFQAYTERWKKVPDWGIGMAAYTPREDRLDPDEMLKFWTCGEAKDAGRNEANYCSPDFEAAYADQARQYDPAQRKAPVRKAQEIMLRDLPAMVTMHLYVRHAYNQDKYDNVVSVPGIGTWNTFNFVQATPRTSDRVFRSSFVSALPALNPIADNFGGMDQDVLRLIYDTLTRTGTDGTPQPGAAQSWRQVDDKTVDITLRPGMQFHDGRPVTADDVVFTIGLFLKEKPAWYVGYLRPLDRAEKTGDLSVRLHLKTPYAPLMLTTLGRIPIMPRHIWQGVTNPRQATQVNLTGSGPYKMKVQTPEQSYRLERFAGHFMAPKSDEVLITKFANKETQFLAMAKGEVYFMESKGLAPEQVPEAMKLPHLKVITEPSIDVRYAVFNMREKSPFQDYDLRLAMAHLLDFKTIEDVIGKGMAQPGRGVVAPASKFYHNEAIPSQEGDGLHYHQYDPAKARSILQAAGYEWDDRGQLYFPKNHKPKLLPK